MTLSLLRSLPLFLVLAVGCGGGMTGTPMTGHMSSLDVHLTEFGSELQTHQSSVGTATATSQLPALEESHVAKALAAIGEMEEVYGSMHTCMNDAGKAPNTETLHGLAEQLKQECHNHQAAMAGVGTLTAASTEESRHQARMTELRETLHHEMAALQPSAASFHCKTGAHSGH